jgi:hypothetical protein
MYAEGVVMYRKFTEQDIPLLKAEIEKDPEHSLVKENQTFLPEIMMNSKNVSLVFEDSQGVVFYTCFRRELLIDIQFCSVDKERIRQCFKEYIPIFAENFKKAGYVTISFTTKNRVLAFFLRRFGFKTEVIQRKAL